MDNYIYLIQRPQILFPLLIWVLFWKGLALWKAAQKKQVYWFIAILVINLLGVFSILYLYVFSEWKTIQKFWQKMSRKRNEDGEDKES